MNILSIKIQTNNIEESKHFYTKVLQLPLIESLEKSFVLQAGQSILTFEQTEENVEVYHFAFNIPSNQIDNALRWSEKHVDLIENVEGNLVTTFETWKAKSIYFTDNNGNILEFIAREDIHVNVQEYFSPSQIINISEIGVVTEKPMVQAEKLIADYGLSYFDKAEPTEQFLALGDDNGLLIMVTPNRNWYPTNIAAKFTCVDIKLELEKLVFSIQSEKIK
ncbi:MAG: VOC family protein [Flavobacteriaceae bacterium]|jgi:catechol-2,3-dioxygenase|nr:VOC family protein [Flavobacteriaceae bacterium]